MKRINLSSIKALSVKAATTVTHAKVLTVVSEAGMRKRKRKRSVESAASTCMAGVVNDKTNPF